MSAHILAAASIVASLWAQSGADDPKERATPSFRAEPMESPAASPSRLPRLATDTKGRLYLSWVEDKNVGEGAASTELKFATLEEKGWGPVRSVASGERWFVNWADFPALSALEDRRYVLAHYLEKSAGGTYDYRVKVVHSVDEGKSWSPPQRLHSDTGPGEHGFVSLVPLGTQGFAAVWLDGRNTKGHGDGSKPGAMALYMRTVGTDGTLGSELSIDDRVCDCCQTAAARTADGALLVAYRDRSGEEVRDISLVRIEGGKLSKSVWTSGDGWKIAGCPVNGPALHVAGERVGLAWFTMGSDGVSRVLCALSKDGGQTFSSAVKIPCDRPFGRVDAVFDSSGRLIITWLEAVGERAEWRVVRVDANGLVSAVQTVVGTESGRDSGLARLASTSRGVLFASTEPGPSPRVAVRRLIWE